MTDPRPDPLAELLRAGVDRIPVAIRPDLAARCIEEAERRSAIVETTPDGVTTLPQSGPSPVPRWWSPTRRAVAAIALLAAATIALVLTTRVPKGTNPDTVPEGGTPGVSPGGDSPRPPADIREADYYPPITTDYDDVRGSGTKILYGGDTIYVKDWSCPARDFRFAWLVKCGPNQIKRLDQLELQGDRFVSHYEGRNAKESGFVLVVLVLSRTDSPILSAKSDVAIDLDREILDALSRLYRDPARNASAIQARLANVRRAWGLPGDALLVPRAYRQVTQPNPGRPDQP